MRDNALQPLRELEEDVPKVFSVAVPANRRYIALGCGSEIFLLRFTEKGSHSTYPPERVKVKASKKMAICAHKISFMPDSCRIVSAVQVQGAPDHQVYTEVFTCTESLQFESELTTVAIAAVSCMSI